MLSVEARFGAVTERGARFREVDLAFFEHPRTWRQIRLEWLHRSEAWLRTAVIADDEFGSGVLVWCKRTLT